MSHITKILIFYIKKKKMYLRNTKVYKKKYIFLKNKIFNKKKLIKKLRFTL